MTASLVSFGGYAYAVSAADFDGDQKAIPILFNITTGMWPIKLATLNYGTVSTTSGYVP